MRPHASSVPRQHILDVALVLRPLPQSAGEGRDGDSPQSANVMQRYPLMGEGRVRVTACAAAPLRAAPARPHQRKTHREPHSRSHRLRVRIRHRPQPHPDPVPGPGTRRLRHPEQPPRSFLNPSPIMETFAQLPHRRMREALRPLPQSAIVLLNPSPLMG